MYRPPKMLPVRRKPGPNGKVARPFLCCVIDDASQCTEPQSLMPLGLGIRKLIMAGDSEQLPIHLTSDVTIHRMLNHSLRYVHVILFSFSFYCSGGQRTQIYTVSLQPAAGLL